MIRRRLPSLFLLLALLPGAWLDDPRLELERLQRTLESERSEWERKEREYRERIASLEERLREATARSLLREEQHLDFTRLLAAIAPEMLDEEGLRRLAAAVAGEEPVPPGEAVVEPPAVPPAAEAPTPETEAARRLDERRRAIALALGSLLVAERVEGLELLESGRVGDGWTGPVVFRVIDERGRPVGTLAADRLRLEGSRTGRSLTMVFEAGYERRGGERVPFEGTLEGVERGGTRRIVLSHVDPRPWIEALPELFSLDSVERVVDDGRWNLLLVQRALNRLLALDGSAGLYRLTKLEGVVEAVLREVTVEELDGAGRPSRVLTADRLSISADGGRVLLTLEDGVQLRDGRKLPFLEGRYRIFLPRAQPAAWSRAGLPGLAPAADSPLGRDLENSGGR
ncbi:MAG: hypothetical protein QF410_01960 [Planctomycetota bacterium]|nr:hypothetical protein [Planctomycetota bacterium]MDP6764325.1 hypothetical protein [Planctomycetota bacterium]